MKKPTLEEIKEIVTLTRNLEGGLEVFNIKGDVLGNIEGDVKGDVYGDVRGDVKGGVFGTVKGVTN